MASGSSEPASRRSRKCCGSPGRSHMRHRALLSVGLAILTVAVVASASAQGPAENYPRAFPSQPTPDSVTVLSAARKAQATFERVRRAHLPRTWTSGAGSRCDETIGRFCYWDDDDTNE